MRSLLLAAGLVLLSTEVSRAQASAGHDAGAAAYVRLCAACHGRAGQGAPGVAPPLAKVPELARTPQGRAYLAGVLTVGVAGPIDVGGQRFAGLMARPGGAPEQRLAILNYLLRSGNGASPAPFTAAELQASAVAGAPHAVARARPRTSP